VQLKRVFILAGVLFAAATSFAYAREMHPFPDQNGCILNFSYSAKPTFAVIWTGGCIDGKAEGTGIGVLYENLSGVWFMQFIGKMHQGRMAGDKVYVQGSDSARGVFSVTGGERRGEGKMIYESPKRGPVVAQMQFDKDEPVSSVFSDKKADNPEAYDAYAKEFERWRSLMVPELGLNGACDAWGHIETVATALAARSAKSAKELFNWPPGPEWIKEDCNNWSIQIEGVTAGDGAAEFAASPTEAVFNTWRRNEGVVEATRALPDADIAALGDHAYVNILNEYDQCTFHVENRRSIKGRAQENAFYEKIILKAFASLGIEPFVLDLHHALRSGAQLPDGTSNFDVLKSGEVQIYKKAIDYPLFGNPDNPENPSIIGAIIRRQVALLELGIIDVKQEGKAVTVTLLQGCR